MSQYRASFAVIIAVFLVVASTVRAQLALETVVLKNGHSITGEVVEIGDQNLTIQRKVGRGVIRQTVKFADLETNGLYSVLVSALSPLDEVDHLRLAEIAFAGGLFNVAERHFTASAGEGREPSPEIKDRIAACTEKDLSSLFDRSTKALTEERFSEARRLAMAILRRYPEHPRTAEAPALIDAINKGHEAARVRAAALARNKRLKAEWERGEKLIDDVDKWLGRARAAEVEGLALTERFREAKDRLDTATKYLGQADRRAIDLRQSPRVPEGLRPRLDAVENEINALQVRTRLHVASLYTVRGSYGTALAYVNGALAYDPANEQALAARARIEEAAAIAGARPFTRFNN